MRLYVLWRLTLKSLQGVIFHVCDAQGSKQSSEEKARYSGPWWISPLGWG